MRSFEDLGGHHSEFYLALLKQLKGVFPPESGLSVILAFSLLGEGVVVLVAYNLENPSLGLDLLETEEIGRAHV